MLFRSVSQSRYMVTSVFAVGMIAWPKFPEDGTLLGNLYYVTTSSVLYALSVIVFIAANSFWWKVGSAIGMSVFGVNLYVELYLDPKKMDFMGCNINYSCSFEYFTCNVYN